MEMMKAESKHTECILTLVQNTIIEVYPKYYSKEIVQFFCDLHCIENVMSDIRKGNVFVLSDEHEIVGTGTVCENHITRVFVDVRYHGMGYGKFIMHNLENIISRNYENVILDSSAGAKDFYLHLNYQTLKWEEYPCANGEILHYEVMEKKLNKADKVFYTARKFEDDKVQSRYFITKEERDYFVMNHQGWKKRGMICIENLEKHLLK